MSERLEWLRRRKCGIGSSDAPALHGESPYLTRYELGEEKLSKEVKEEGDNFVTRIGNEMELIARQRFAALYNMEHGTQEEFLPRCVEMSDLPFMRASLDGCSKDGRRIVEFKFMSKPRAGETLTKGQKKHMDVLKGGVGKAHWIQMQHQLLVSGAEVCHYVSFDGESLHDCIVMPDEEFMKKHLALCEEFWNLVTSGKSQPIGPEDYKELRAKLLVQKWKQLKRQSEDISSELDVLRELILSKVTHPRMFCDGVRILQMPGNRGSIDYKAAFTSFGGTEDAAERFRKPDGNPFYKMEIE